MLTRFRKGVLRAIVALFSVAVSVSADALTFPELTGRVVDDAGILDPATNAALERKLADFETKTTGQLVVVTLKSLQGTSIEDYGYQLGRHWQIGQKDKNTGALLIVAPNERKVRIEVGYGFEGTLTDAVSKLIIENSIIPRLRANDCAGGIGRGVDDIIQAVSVDSEEWKAPLPLIFLTARPAGIIYLFQLAAFIVVALVLSLPMIRFRIVPKRRMWTRAHADAMHQFLAQGIHLTEHRTGVLILASVAERYAEIVADSGINAKVRPEVWSKAVAAMISAIKDGRPGGGFVAAVELCGEQLARHFPPGALNPDELPNKVVEI